MYHFSCQVNTYFYTASYYFGFITLYICMCVCFLSGNTFIRLCRFDWNKSRKINDTFPCYLGSMLVKSCNTSLDTIYRGLQMKRNCLCLWGATSNFFGCLLERRVCFANRWDRFWRTDIEHEILYAQLPNKKMTDVPFQGIVHMTPKHGPPATSRS